MGIYSLVAFCIFLILKLTNQIDWSWWTVTCPLWIGPAMFLVIFISVIVIVGIITFAPDFSRWVYNHSVGAIIARKLFSHKQ